MRRRTAQAPPPPGGLCIGMVVYDRSYEMVGVIDDFVGALVHLSRPTGLTWQSRWVSVRPATAYERRQLRAIEALHKVQQKGLTPHGR